MMDCWWNVAAENQAMDRVHRIGQKRPVRVMRFLVKDSIEERIVALQEAKVSTPLVVLPAPNKSYFVFSH